jgi:hypothetical protein
MPGMIVDSLAGKRCVDDGDDEFTGSRYAKYVSPA